MSLLLAVCLCLGVFAASATADRETFAVSLLVEPTKVKKNDDTKLTAIVKPAGTCTKRAVLFQVKDGRDWDKVTKNIKVDSSCRVTHRVEVRSKSVFRVLLIDPKEPRTLVTSPSVTVKLR